MRRGVTVLYFIISHRCALHQFTNTVASTRSRRYSNIVTQGYEFLTVP